jgi:ferredoxin, 2Fe-2S
MDSTYTSIDQSMLQMKVVDRDAIEHEVAAEAGLTVMEVLRDLDYGVAAVCGGMCSCATCHVYVAPEWAPHLAPADSGERELLGELAHTRRESRLSCQIALTEALDGLQVTIAPEE